jgi:hypothetical protein
MKIDKALLSREVFLNAPEEVRDTIEQLVTYNNERWDLLYKLLSGRVSLKDNIQCIVSDIQFNYSDLYGTPTYEANFSDWSADVEGPVAFRKTGGGWAEISGLGKGDISAAPHNVLTVPTGFEPAKNEALWPGSANSLPALYSLRKDTSKIRLDYFASSAANDVTLSFRYRYRLADATPLRPSGDFPLLVDCTKLGLRPTGLFVMRTELLEGRSGRIVANGTPVWESSTDGKKIVVKVRDFEGLLPGKYRVRLLIFP